MTAATPSPVGPQRFALTGGRIIKVEVNVADDRYLDLERQLQAALARD